MQLRQLGTSEVKVTPLFLGTWAIGGWMWGGTDEKKAIEAIQMSIDEGVFTIDTAAVYGMGLSEEIVGKAIRGRKDKVVIATKCGLRWEGDEKKHSAAPPKAQIEVVRNSAPKSLFFECEQSLKRLGIDVIDLYQIHWPDPKVPIEESWNAMAALKKQGKVRAIGVSNYSLEQLKSAHAVYPVDSIQLPYSLVRREIEKEIIPYCRAHNISVIVYSPLERGLFTGKYKDQLSFPSGDHRAEKATFAPSYLRNVERAFDAIRPIAERHKASLSQAILNCTMHRAGITGTLVGARNASQAKENAQAAALNLSAKEREAIALALADTALQRPLYE